MKNLFNFFKDCFCAFFHIKFRTQEKKLNCGIYIFTCTRCKKNNNKIKEDIL